MSDVPKRKGVSAIDFFCIGFGAIVGVGWAVSINGWMTSCGGPIPAALGYLLVLVMMVPIGLCYAELVPMLPVAGGGMAFSFKAFNDKVALISGWASLGGMIAIIPWEAIQITDVLGYLVPGIKTGPVLYSVMGYDIHLIVVIIGTVCSLLLFALNMRGLAAAALFQKILCIVLVGAGVVGAIAALIGGRAENLTPVYDVTNPEIYGEGLKQVSHHTMLGGMFAIVVQAAFFLAGFETIPQGIEDAGGSVKSVGKTVVLSVTLACVFYAVLLFCFGYGWPWQEFAGMARP
ncbi:MAG: APC family permease, partial [Eubacterium sp.]|nr:APC family permease [Eubacterium sp.]